MMQHKDWILLKKIKEEISLGIEMMGETSEKAFLKNEMLKRAESMTAINIGELIKNVSPELKKKYPQIPWKAIAGMRDITAHKYQTLRMEDVYQTVNTDFPALERQIEEIIEREKEDI